MSRQTIKAHLAAVERAVTRRGPVTQPAYKLTSDQIRIAAELVVAVNSRLNAPQVNPFSETVCEEMDAIIDRHVRMAMLEYGINCPKLAVVIRESVTCALYLKLEDLLSSLSKHNLKLKR